ncbi:uncharacterized protein LOC141589910 [Silene latifolia]|uniref:uncharacterized protein LOC141589910 n=1 Tax=Silene latifolia TaxID=37657 RepID=UPI003D770A9B
MKSWDSCCAPYTEGGFNIKEILVWNKCIICKWIWGIIQHSDSIWTNWNYAYNIKSGDFWTLQKKNTHSESWRSILLVRDELLNMVGNGPTAESLLSGCVKKGCIQLSLLYDKFRRKGNPISWGATVWHRAVLPKHSVFLMLAMKQKLATIDKLNHRGISLVNRCVLCKADNETHKHLVFQCIFSAAIWHQVLHWLRVQHRTSKLSKEVH